MSEHFGHPMPQPPTDAGASDLAHWAWEDRPDLPPAMECHLDLWLRRNSAECEVEALRRRWRDTDDDNVRREIADRAAGIQATIERMTEDLDAMRPAESRAA